MQEKKNSVFRAHKIESKCHGSLKANEQFISFARSSINKEKKFLTNFSVTEKISVTRYLLDIFFVPCYREKRLNQEISVTTISI